MKNFSEGMLRWTSSAGSMFAASIIIYSLVSLGYGNSAIKVSIVMSLFLICILGSFIQFLAFTEYLIKKMRYCSRVLLFVALFLPLMTLCAYLFQWFPVDSIGPWMIFLAIFFGIFIVTMGAFEIYYQATGKKYDGLLGQYKRDAEKKNRGDRIK